ncbi:DUF962 domain-containing protein [Pseudoalteromonas sp. SSDWG2]|uniref:Mpo1 family 2-hydroxy fatty acid dioxygenase n=1 Tax=Pseudoalteromonas sp. SSDWG2 TaxID=3139391 RepID=UPI003BA860C4
MKSLTQQLANYALYHRDKRNIYTHFVGIPMIVFAIVILLSKPALLVLDVTITPATVIACVTCLYYLRLSLSIGVVMSVLFSLAVIGATPFAAMQTTHWLGWGIGLFVVGWVFQFVGHFFEGKKPAFVDDLIGLIIGPLFVVVEVLFMLGLYKSLENDIVEIAGPTH